MTKKVGRPTKYGGHILKKTKYYMNHFQDFGDLVPSIAGLACELNINRDTIYSWIDSDGKEEFSDMLGQLLAKQERMLLSGGLGGSLNSNITKLMLCKHGYSDRQEVEQHNTGDSVMTIIHE